MYKKNFCLIICGPAISERQLLTDVENYYNQHGIKNIVVSTYSNYISDDLKKYSKVVECDADNMGISEVKAPIKFMNRSVTLKYNPSDTIKGVLTNSNTFFQLQTAKYGIRMADREFQHCKYYMKVRADMYLPRLMHYIKRWHRILHLLKLENDIFDQKLIVKKRSLKITNPWYICDFLICGTKEDIRKYYFFRRSVLKLDPKFTDMIKGAEAVISSGYILERNPNITFDEACQKYFYFEHIIRCRWWKHDAVSEDKKSRYLKYF